MGMFRRVLLGAILFSLVSGAARAQLPAALDDLAIRRAAVATFPEFLDFLTLPNDSRTGGEAVRANAEWLLPALARRGFETRVCANGGKPLVLAAAPARPGLRTILFYLHFDGQPVIPGQWAQASPWQPVVKRRRVDGGWEAVDPGQLLTPAFDPELRVFARSASDDKGPILMFLAAMDLLKGSGLAPAVNVKLLLDGQEEAESAGVPVAVREFRDFLKADALVLLDAAAHPSGRPTAVFGNRGIQTLTLTVYGPKAPLHSGHYGNYVPNPVFGLARLLAAMKDPDGRVAVPGYYATTTLTGGERAALARVGDDEPALRARVGIARSEPVGGNYQESLQYPSLNVRGMAAAGVGPEAANIIPKEAVAELDLRTTMEADGAYLTGLLRDFIARQGFTLVDHEPTDADRQRFPRLARLREGGSTPAARQPMDSPVGHWVARALAGAFRDAEGHGPEPVLLRAMGATVPTHAIVGPLGLPFVLVPVVNADNNQHTYDENLRMGNYLSGMRAMLGLLTTPYEP